MTEQLRLGLQEKAEIHLTKSLYMEQVSFTAGTPAVCGIGNPALCALSSLQSSVIELLPHESRLMCIYSALIGGIHGSLG